MAPVHTLRLLCAALLLAAAPLPARALQLGEKKAHILARHGAPGAEDRGKGVAIYFWTGWSAELEFKEDAVHKLIYRRESYLQPSEIASLLQSNGGSARWRETTATVETMRQWVRDDGANATCLATRPMMITIQAGAGLAASGRERSRRDTPNVAVPAVPPVVSSTPPSFPKLPGSEPPPAVPLTPVRAGELRPLPKLPAEEVTPATETLNVKSAPEPESSQSPPMATPPVVAGEPPSAETVPPAAASGSSLPVTILLSLVGLGLLLGGAFYLFKVRGRREGLKEVKARRVTSRREPAEPLPPTPALDSLRHDQFELLVGEIFRREGYTVELSAAAAEGNSIDLTLRRDSETILVQCKHWKASRVTEREVREFYGAMMANGSPRGIFVTTGSFSRDAEEFAEGKQIDLMDRAALEESTAAVTRPGENFCAIGEWVGEFTAHARVFDPECPICQGAMVIRHHRASGAASWCCRHHPRCPGRREPRLDLLAAA